MKRAPTAWTEECGAPKMNLWTTSYILKWITPKLQQSVLRSTKLIKSDTRRVPSSMAWHYVHMFDAAKIPLGIPETQNLGLSSNISSRSILIPKWSNIQIYYVFLFIFVYQHDCDKYINMIFVFQCIEYNVNNMVSSISQFNDNSKHFWVISVYVWGCSNIARGCGAAFSLLAIDSAAAQHSGACFLASQPHQLKTFVFRCGWKTCSCKR